jgi:methionyl-tRNA synthetase
MAIAICPFLPESAQKIWNQLGFVGKVNENKWDFISNLLVKPGHLLGEISPLFVKVEEEEIEKYKKQLGPSE